MMTEQERARIVVEAQPEDASIEEIIRELAFELMIARGMEDARLGRMIDNEEMARRLMP